MSTHTLLPTSRGSVHSQRGRPEGEHVSSWMPAPFIFLRLAPTVLAWEERGEQIPRKADSRLWLQRLFVDGTRKALLPSSQSTEAGSGEVPVEEERGRGVRGAESSPEQI